MFIRLPLSYFASDLPIPFMYAWVLPDTSFLEVQLIFQKLVVCPGLVPQLIRPSYSGVTNEERHQCSVYGSHSVSSHNVCNTHH